MAAINGFIITGDRWWDRFHPFATMKRPVAVGHYGWTFVSKIDIDDEKGH